VVQKIITTYNPDYEIVGRIKQNLIGPQTQDDSKLIVSKHKKLKQNKTQWHFKPNLVDNLKSATKVFSSKKVKSSIPQVPV
jgi:E3 ubiquitin-protein ligase DOA10